MTRRRTVSALAAALLLGIFPSAASALTPNPKASAMAELIAHKPITALCGDTQREWDSIPYVRYWTDRGTEPDGLADITADTIYLSPWVCQQLAKRSPRAGVAASVVVHEAVHVALFSWDEARVECIAGLNYWPAIHSLGFPHALERAAYQAAWQSHLRLANDPSGTYAWKGHC